MRHFSNAQRNVSCVITGMENGDAATMPLASAATTPTPEEITAKKRNRFDKFWLVCFNRSLFHSGSPCFRYGAGLVFRIEVIVYQTVIKLESAVKRLLTGLVREGDLV